ncbi:transglycosylase domain-containing protein [Vibrio parahaemolyticus]|nr:transglycosylase domain-containing protein [Vibrio parahaemolyticus]
MLLAPWLDKALEKRRILEVYICSVRYENRCFGVVPAMQHFFGEIIQNPSKAQAFFLVERVSNIRKSLLANKIVATAKTAKEKGILSDSDLKELSSIYKRVVSDGKVIDHNNSLERLVEQLNA